MSASRRDWKIVHEYDRRGRFEHRGAAALVSAAWLLFRRHPWGYVLAVVALVQFAIYFVVMTTVCVYGWMLTPGSSLFSAWFINCIVTLPIILLCLAGLLLNVKRPAEAN